ncbi:MAG TPA: orotidine-5'-phosphate decarboxylase [Porticoccaceae bacterium]|nr:orotidine-5'-phosphate decarboxylase [Porticoccaceae bacterium]
MRRQGPRIIVALDYPDAAAALALVRQLRPELCRLKVGKELFTAAGPRLVEGLVAAGFDVFLDLKFHDIPSTVAKAVAAAGRLGVWMVNVHASGGTQMMRAARETIPAGGPLLIAVTVLTSMSQRDLDELGVALPLPQQVLHLAGLAQHSGLDGVVCSAEEARAIRERLGDDFLCVTPGIRLATAEADDQQRVMTPEAALQAGSSYLVIGRPVTQAVDPAAALLAIATRIADHGVDAK